MRRTTRLEYLEQILLDHPDGLRVTELSERCGVDRRTIYRDLELMQEMNIPIWQSNGRFGIERERYMTSLRINLNETFVLVWAMRLLTLHTEIQSPYMRSLLKKITAALPPELAAQVEMLQSSTAPMPRQDHLMKIIDNVAHAWADSLKLMIWYKKPNAAKPLRRVIAPYLLDTTPQGRLFIIGVEEQTREVRVFYLHHITRAEVLKDEPFRRSPNLDIRQYVSAAYDQNDKNLRETVVLRFQPSAAAVVKHRQWYPYQKIESYEDGSCIFIAEVMDWQEMEKWVRSWGAQVEVIAPAEFRKTIAAEFRQAARLYG